jgi:hypothetical protein
MRQLTEAELTLVSGGTGQCTPQGNNYGGVTNTGGVGRDLINIYEGVVAAASHIIERVANAF